MRKIIFRLMIFALLFTACVPRTDRGMQKPDERCIITGVDGRCWGSFSTVRGENIHYYEHISMYEDDAVFLEMVVKINSGTISIVVNNYDHEPSEFTATAESPAIIEMWVRGDGTGYLPIAFNVPDGQVVENVQYSFEFERYIK